MVDINYHLDDPNNRRYSNTSLGTWSSISDVDAFFSRFNRNTIYKDGDTKLSVGNYIKIQDGTHNIEWEIAGFDLEHNQYASDDTLYDNRYGICLIPKTYIGSYKWNDLSNSVAGAYNASLPHTTYLPTYASNLQTVLGSHLIQRNVLLSNGVSNHISSGYVWTTAYATLMSVGQMTGTFGANNNKYDDGEASYKLPIFNTKSIKTGSVFWTRCVYGNYNSSSRRVFAIDADGNVTSYAASAFATYRPMIYLR